MRGAACPIDTPPELLSATRYRARAHGGGINSWVYEYGNSAPLGKSWVGCGLEIGVQLRGTWKLTSRFSEAHAYERGEICRVSVGERYAHAYQGRTERGLQVGFIVCSEAIRDVDGELRFVGDSGRRDRRFVELAASCANEVGISDDETIAAVNDYVQRHCELVPASPLVACKRELERYFASDLGVEHLAAAGGLHPATFVRQFKAAYGMTPVAYRIMFRANYGARLLWMRPDLSVAEISEECGFPNVSYFHRTFKRCFGMSPATVRTRMLGAS